MVRKDRDCITHKQCSVENQIKFSTCSLLEGAHGRGGIPTLDCGHDVANEMKIARGGVVEFESNRYVVTGYKPTFPGTELCVFRMFPEESDKVERYVGGLPDMIHGNVVASKPKTMQEATEMATELME
ncbi:hypothetical protein Tco_0951034 [Tanacetum coccineum]|uniref:Uncharacterized protein n=1 Tax=Tanacetum coccineum TaxID=301880 RepID=A0ABQ5DTX1_9ASTR